MHATHSDATNMDTTNLDPTNLDTTDTPEDDRRLASACILGSFDGTEAPAWLLDAALGGLGGVLLFAQNVVDDAQVARLCAQLHDANPDLVIAIDEEGGDVTRLDARTGSDTPCPAAFGAVDDLVATRAAFAGLGARLRSLGIDLTLAPCADVNSNPRNPIIGVRSFGIEPDRVAAHVVACADGFRAGGTEVCLKHFPGHGDTSADTHLGPARIDASLDTMRARELVPFARAIDAGVAAVLTAHIVVDSVDALPASLSSRWTAMLRDEMGFDGVVITDALDMDAVAEGRGVDGVAHAAVQALVAGADLLCLGSNFTSAWTSQVLDAIVAAISGGVVDRDDLRVHAARNRSIRATPPLDSHHEARSELDGRAAAQLVATGALRVDGALPAPPYFVVHCRPRLNMACFNVAWGLAGRAADDGWPVHDVTDATDIAAILASNARALPVLVVVRDAAVQPWQFDVIEQCAASTAGCVIVELGWPGAPLPPAAAPLAVITTHGAARISADAAHDLIAGRSAPIGTEESS